MKIKYYVNIMSLYYLRKYLYPVLHSIRFIIEKLVEHTFPRKKDQTRKHKCAYQIYYDYQMKMCAEKFHDLFKTSINFDNLEDIFDRDIIYKKVEVDNTYPKYLVDNINYYKDWII